MKKGSKKEIPSKTFEVISIIKNEWKDFHNTTDNEEKMNHIMEMMFGIFLYNLIRYDYHNFLRLVDEVKKEDKENGQ